MKKAFVGIDLGATNVKIGCFDNDLKTIAKTSIPVDTEITPQDAVERIGRTIEQLLQQNNLSIDALEGTGVGSTGQFDLARGFMISNPNLTKFQKVPLRDMLSERIGTAVVLDNDGNAACYGEWVVGAGRGVDDIAFFTLGTGIGGGLICGGKLLHGSGDNAAELGHIIIYPDGRLCGCGQRGCVEAYGSASSTARRATEAVIAGEKSSLKKTLEENGRITSKDVFQHMKAGDKLAEYIVDGTAKALALVSINVLHTTEPKRIVFAGGMIAAGKILLDKINHFFKLQIWSLKEESPQLRFATLGEDAGIIGAAALAKHEEKAK